MVIIGNGWVEKIFEWENKFSGMERAYAMSRAAPAYPRSLPRVPSERVGGRLRLRALPPTRCYASCKLTQVKIRKCRKTALSCKYPAEQTWVKIKAITKISMLKTPYILLSKNYPQESTKKGRKISSGSEFKWVSSWNPEIFYYRNGFFKSGNAK